MWSDVTKTPKLFNTWLPAAALCLLLLFQPGLVGAAEFGVAFESLLEEELEEQMTEELEEGLEEALEDDLEEELEDELEEELEEEREEELEEELEEEMEDELEEEMEDELEEEMEDELEEEMEDELDEELEDELDEELEDEFEEEVEDELGEELDEGGQGQVDDLIGEVGSRRTEDDFDASVLGDSDQQYVGEWLILAETKTMQLLAAEGYLFDKQTTLKGLGLELVQVSAPGSFDIDAIRGGIVEVIGSKMADVDVNHLYTAGEPDITSEGGFKPAVAMQFPTDTATLPLRIGMVDGGIDTSHPALSKSNIELKHFLSEGGRPLSRHGTAVVSLLCASDEGYTGLAPKSHIFAAVAFEHEAGREVSTTANMILALDWLSQQQLHVINLSISGPPNKLLERVINRITANGINIVASAGNGGPAAPSAYPAAYESVIAVTAVDNANRVYRRANRGKYLDLAAPGVNIRHARSGGEYVSSSGTSFAAPFVSIAVARLRFFEVENLKRKLYRSTVDLGPAGWDPVFGFGLISPGN